MHLMDLNLDDPKFAGGGAPTSLRLSPDGSHWLVSTDAQLMPDDTDLTEDWYLGSSSGWTHIPGGMGTITQLFTTANDSVIVWASADRRGRGRHGRHHRHLPLERRERPARPTSSRTARSTARSTHPRPVDRWLAGDLLDGRGPRATAMRAVDIYRWEGGDRHAPHARQPERRRPTRPPRSTASASSSPRSTRSSPPTPHPSDEDVYVSDEDTTAPTATVSTLPNGSGATADLTLGSSDSSAVFFSCTLDGNPQACGVSTHLTGLAAGSHTLAVTAYDAAWNQSDVVQPDVERRPRRSRPRPTPAWTFRTGTTLSSGRALIRLVWTAADTGGSGVGTYDVEQWTDSGSYVRIATGLTSPTWDRFLSGPHNYRFRIRATDKAGNAGDWVYGSLFRLTAVSQASSGVKYGPTTSRWHTVTSTTYWGGTAKYASTASSTASYSFTGRSFAWVSLKASTRGKANVYVDGVLKATIDLRSTTTLKQQVVWQTTFATSARHTVMIKVLGTSGRPRVDVDGFFYGS